MLTPDGRADTRAPGRAAKVGYGPFLGNKCQQILALASRDGTLTGPYGRNAPHSAFLLHDTLGPIDELMTRFQANEEVDGAYLVPVACIDGSALNVQVGGQQLCLRNKEAGSLASAGCEGVHPAPSS